MKGCVSFLPTHLGTDARKKTLARASISGFRNALFRFKAALVIQRIWKTILTCRATAATVQQIVENRRLKMDELSIRCDPTYAET